MSHLIDTNVISELRKGKRCDARVAAWFGGVDNDEFFLSVLTIGEIRRGIESIGRRNRKSASVLNKWLLELIESFNDRILPIDRAIAEEWGKLNVRHTLPVIDGLLAATAQVRGLTVVTRNTKDITRTGVSCLNPFLPSVPT